MILTPRSAYRGDGRTSCSLDHSSFRYVSTTFASVFFIARADRWRGGRSVIRRFAPPPPLTTQKERSLRPNGTDGRAASSIHHDLHPIAHLDLRVCVEPVQHAEALHGVVDVVHAVGEGFDGVAGLHGDDLDAQRAGGL